MADINIRVEVMCLACGSTIPKATERRNICNTSSELIVSVTLSVRLNERANLVYHTSLFSLIMVKSGRRIREIKRTYICRKCFYAFEKLQNCEEVN